MIGMDDGIKEYLEDDRGINYKFIKVAPLWWQQASGLSADPTMAQ